MVEIKKLPPGEAEGARDLQTWGHRRLAGRSGLRKDKPKKDKRGIVVDRLEIEDKKDAARWLRAHGYKRR